MCECQQIVDNWSYSTGILPSTEFYQSSLIIITKNVFNLLFT